MEIRRPDDAPEEGTSDPRPSGRGRFAAGTPDDVAALYTWANLQGARYKDFSASRRLYREQIRNQAADGTAAPAPVVEVEHVAAGEESRPRSRTLEERRKGGSAIRWAASQRSWESSSRAAGREQIAQRTPQALAEAEAFAPAPLPLQPVTSAEGTAYEPMLREGIASGRTPSSLSSDDGFPGFHDDPLYRGSSNMAGEERWERYDPEPAQADRTFATPVRPMDTESHGFSEPIRTWEPDTTETRQEFNGPAWLYGSPHESVRSRIRVNQPSRRVSLEPQQRTPAHAWSAMRAVVENEWTEPRETKSTVPAGQRAPLLVLCSMGGGVGRTTLLATVGRALSSNGERVVLGDASPCSLLPFFFGGSELRPGEMRGFAPPEESVDSPIFLVNYDLAQAEKDANEQRRLVGEILRNGAECHRILLDLPLGSEWLLRRLATLQPTILVPLVPDMNSVVNLEGVERYFERFSDEDGNPVLPFYLFNQFDPSLRLHQDVRDLLWGRLGERLLSFAVRRSPAVSEALAEGTTVTDYAPDSPIARDYFDVAVWLRTISPPMTASPRTARSGRG